MSVEEFHKENVQSKMKKSQTRASVPAVLSLTYSRLLLLLFLGKRRPKVDVY